MNYSQVQWVEKENDVFALVLGQGHVLELSIDDGLGGEVGGWFAQG